MLTEIFETKFLYKIEVFWGVILCRLVNNNNNNNNNNASQHRNNLLCQAAQQRF
jgi:hypothetical protein